MKCLIIRLCIRLIRWSPPNFLIILPAIGRVIFDNVANNSKVSSNDANDNEMMAAMRAFDA